MRQNLRAGLLTLQFLTTILAFGMSFCLHAESDRYAVLATATVQEDPPQISFEWPLDEGTPGFPVNSYTVYRQSGIQPSSWGAPIAVLPGSATNFVDTNVVVGQTYEYQFVKSAASLTGYGYSWAGIRAPLIEDRGRIILLVDDSFTNDLASELTRLQKDLVGDGWSVIRYDVSRNAPVVSIRNLIRSDWQKYIDVRAVFLLGRIPVPYAGNIFPDEKDHHKGAWPADVYYGEMDGFWGDFFVNISTADDPRNHNIPGDGKFDQSFLPSNVDLQVGRVDLANMPGKFFVETAATFAEEKELVRQYLNKDHAYRQKHFTFARRGIIHDGAGARDGVAGAATIWRALSTWVGYTNIDVDVDDTWLHRVSTNSYLASFVSDAGDYNGIGRVGGTGNFGAANTAEMVSSNMQCGFYAFLGSWLGDWDTQDNLLRGMLATTNCGLAAIFGGTPHWFMHHMGLGQNIGFAARLSQNNIPQFYNNQISPNPRNPHVALMGDPTLRLFMVAPPSNLVATVTTTDVQLKWHASPDAALGYHVYRSTSANGYFTRLNASPLTTTNYNDATRGRGTNFHMVRALMLETSASGTYTNASQGILASANVTSGPVVPPKISLMLLTETEARIEAFANTGLQYKFFASSNLVNWELLASLTATNSPFEFSDPMASNFSARYYQVSAQP